MAVNNTDPLTWNVPIVDPKTGRPTTEFQRKWLEQQRINQLPPDIQAALDTLGTARGAIIVRTSSGWALLAPGAIGEVLTAHGAGADLTWATGSGSGGVGQTLYVIDDTLYLPVVDANHVPVVDANGNVVYTTFTPSGGSGLSEPDVMARVFIGY